MESSPEGAEGAEAAADVVAGASGVTGVVGWVGFALVGLAPVDRALAVAPPAAVLLAGEAFVGEVAFAAVLFVPVLLAGAFLLPVLEALLADFLAAEALAVETLLEEVLRAEASLVEALAVGALGAEAFAPEALGAVFLAAGFALVPRLEDSEAPEAFFPLASSPAFTRFLLALSGFVADADPGAVVFAFAEDFAPLDFVVLGFAVLEFAAPPAAVVFAAEDFAFGVEELEAPAVLPAVVFRFALRVRAAEESRVSFSRRLFPEPVLFGSAASLADSADTALAGLWSSKKTSTGR